jgi:hypothetical protein
MFLIIRDEIWPSADKSATSVGTSTLRIISPEICLNQGRFTEQRFVDRESGSRPFGSGDDGELNIARRVSNDVQAGNIGFLKIAGVGPALLVELEPSFAIKEDFCRSPVLKNIARLASVSPLAKTPLSSNPSSVHSRRAMGSSRTGISCTANRSRLALDSSAGLSVQSTRSLLHRVSISDSPLPFSSRP